ncbi:hypothetical protein NRY95_02960 [Xanthomonas campestris pv. phormiicola]|nr:hypothetical protein NRY95_02960 [Xanthomonas campestris pv. phormiicola]
MRAFYASARSRSAAAARPDAGAGRGCLNVGRKNLVAMQHFL